MERHGRCDSLSLPRRVPTHYVYPQALVQPSVVIPHVQATPTPTSSFLDYASAYAQYSAAAAVAAAGAAGAAYEQYPYAASPAPAGFTAAGYGFASQQALATAAATPGPASMAFGQYQPQTLQADHMQ